MGTSINALRPSISRQFAMAKRLRWMKSTIAAAGNWKISADAVPTLSTKPISTWLQPMVVR